MDSRAYAFAYLIKEPSELPADFPVDHGFEYALFLPRESVPRFETPRYVPRLLLLWPDRLSVHSHPSCGLAETTIRLADISYFELERFMANCSLTFFSPAETLPLPFHGRDEEFVGTFLSRIQQRLRTTFKRPPLPGEPQAFGPEPSYNLLGSKPR